MFWVGWVSGEGGLEGLGLDEWGGGKESWYLRMG